MFKFKPEKRSRISVFLCAVAFVFFVSAGSAFAAGEWMQDSLNQLVGWGIMQGYPDGQLHENDDITRAEFVSMANRSFGYTEKGPTPFTDVPASAWYAGDIAIAYNAGYFAGTSPNTASPNANLTREQAIVLLAHCLRLEETPGEVTQFSDGRTFRSWSQGFVSSVTRAGLISGYPDGTFRPQKNVTRGEMARMLSNALGTLINEEGSHRLHGVYGNVTINSPNVTLRDTTIAGDLYITGGLGLGDVRLENVEVLGRIIVAGCGESQDGDPSVILRNVEAKELIVDNLIGQYVSVSLEGDTDIGKATLRSTCYLQDHTRSRYGVDTIYLDGKSGTEFTLAGSLKTVINRTPKSLLTIAKGTVENLTIDEKAPNSSLYLSTNTVVENLNLDTGTKVTGNGDIDRLIVSAPGSSVTMLPDDIIIRPGISATINGQVMDTVAGEESSATPRLLSGYPKPHNVASTSLNILFSGNKSGTVYWAVSAVSDGSVDADDLISPPSYGSSILKSGKIKLNASNTEVSVKVTGLEADGTYYISAVLVDAHDWRSSRKVVTFTTPDDSVPAFSSGHPYISKITNISGQVTAMATKSCQLYYALLPSGAKAPTPNEFRAQAITGNYGFGIVSMEKNVADSFTVNDRDLKELDTYDLYLWLTDADGAKSSSVKKLTFTTVDKTPPVFNTQLTVNSVKETSIGFFCNLNENGTVYWVAVKEGTEYPKPPAGTTEGAVDWTDPYAKLQVSSGMNALKSGKVSAKGNTDTKFTVSGLTAETAYDIYYVAVDTAGNYSDSIYKLTANTLDNIAPRATQEFTKYSGTNATTPYADTDIRIVFSENIQRASTNEILLTLYENAVNATGEEQQAARETLAESLRNTVKLYNATGSGLPALAAERDASYDGTSPWVIDYRNAVLTLEEGKLIVTFPTNSDASKSALSLNSGSTYFFRLEDIADTSTSKNRMGVTDLDRFTTISAQVALSNDINISTLDTASSTGIPVDMAFTMTPLSTSKVEDTIDWDMLLWLDTSANFTLYLREQGEPLWEEVGTTSITIPSKYKGYVGRSVGYDLLKLAQGEFPALRTLDESKVYEYAIHFNEVEGISDRTAMSQYITCRISVVSGSTNELKNLGADVSEDRLKAMVSQNLIDKIGTPEPFQVHKQFKDEAPPVFTDRYPRFSVSDTSAEMTLLLSRPGTVYYVIAPVGDIVSKKDGVEVDFDDVPEDGSDRNAPFTLSSPSYLNIVNPSYTGNPNIQTGSTSVGTGAVSVPIGGLRPSTDYYVYYVIKGTGQTFSEVELFRFTTPAVTRPVITLARDNAVVTIKSDLTATVNYMLIPYNNNMNGRLSRPFYEIVAEEDMEHLTNAQKKDSFTVLNAMATDVVQNDRSIGSLFDLYAIQDAKDDLSNYIRTATPSGGNTVAGTGTASVPSNRSVNVDCSKLGMSQNAQYCFLAVGRSDLGSGYAFRATYPLTLVDKDAPKIIDLNSTLTVNPTKGTISGTVSLVFDEYLYYSKPVSGSMPTLYQIDRGPINRNDTPGFISIAALVASKTNTITVVTDDSLKGLATLTIDLQFKNASNGSYITFDANLSDKNSVVASSPLNISVRIDEFGNPQVLISPAWDNRK